MYAGKMTGPAGGYAVVWLLCAKWEVGGGTEAQHDHGCQSHHGVYFWECCRVLREFGFFLSSLPSFAAAFL